MNFELKNMPVRTNKPRESGISMIMDKGLSLREIEDMLSVAGSYIDIVKLGFGSAAVTPILDEKIALYKSHKIPLYFGGTLLESFIIRGQFEDYIRLLDRYQLDFAEVSDGSIDMEHEQKCEYIRRLAKQATIFS